jgi:hypothetical protein
MQEQGLPGDGLRMPVRLDQTNEDAPPGNNALKRAAGNE